MMKTFAASMIAILLATAPVAAQSIPAAGYSGDPLRFWQGYSVGTYVLVGGVLFLVTIGGLALVGDDSKAKTPAPVPAPPASTTTTSTS